MSRTELNALFAWIMVVGITAGSALAQGEPAGAQDEPEVAADPAVVVRKGDMVSISVGRKTTLTGFLDQIVEVIQRPIIYDPNNQRLRGRQFGTAFRHEVPVPRFLDACRALLAFHELILVPVGPKGYEIYLVLDSRSTNNFIKNKMTFVAYEDLEKYADRDGVYISCAIPVRHIENLTTLRTSLSALTSPAGIGRVHEVPGAQAILVTDFAPAVVAMARLISRMDQAPTGEARVMEVVELRYARAPELAETISKLLEGWTPAPAAQAARRAPSSRSRALQPRVVAYEPRNALLIAADKADADRLRALIASLDQPKKVWASVDT